MAIYSSPVTTVHRPAAELAAKFSDFRALQLGIDALPEDKRKAIGDLSFTEDAICINTPQMGTVKLRATERTPERIVLEAEGSPLPMKLQINLKATGEQTTDVSGAIDIDLPMMLKPLVGPSLQKAADQFGKMFASLA